MSELEGPEFAELRAMRKVVDSTHAMVATLVAVSSGLSDRTTTLEHVQTKHAEWIAADQRAIAELKETVALVTPAPPAPRRRGFSLRLFLAALATMALGGTLALVARSLVLRS